MESILVGGNVSELGQQNKLECSLDHNVMCTLLQLRSTDGMQYFFSIL